MVRYLPQLEWFKVDLMKGEFNTEMWTLFLSILGKDPLINEGLKLFEDFSKKKLTRITKIYEVPAGELSLKIGTDIFGESDHYRNPDILFEFNYQYSKETRDTARLKIERARFYKDNTTGNGLNIDKYAF